MQQGEGFFVTALPRNPVRDVAESRYPGLANLAAQVEMFGMSKREIDKKFTRSEMAILGWRSQEISASLQKQSDGVTTSNTDTQVGRKSRRRQQDGVPENLPDHFYNENGEVDLRQVTGAEAYKYFQKQGIRLPLVMVNEKPKLEK